MQLPATKFEIGAEVRHRLSDSTRAKYVVQEITSITCTAGTQVFYDCRVLVKDRASFPPSEAWEPGIVSQQDLRAFTTRFREDELAVYDAS